VPLVRYHAEYAWLDGPEPVADVAIEVDGGRIVAVHPGEPEAGAVLKGLTMPGFANAHSHAFHRAMRGRTQSGPGTFWTWRDQMYTVAARLDPDSYYRLARATYAEMVLAGITCVGEFHYLHHAPDGTRYADPNAMGRALLAAAKDAGIRITLLDTLYLTSSVDGAPLAGPQVRFGDGSVDAWLDRIAELKPEPHALIGTAVHSVRAVPETALRVVPKDRTFHLHLSEQRAENEAAQAKYGRSPTQLLADAGALTPNTTAVHATHLSTVDIRLLDESGTGVCLCPTTERDLADGLGPAGALNTPLCLGSDSQAVIDPFEEARGLELNERLRTERRGHFTAAALVATSSGNGHRALGWSDAGRIAPGYRADLVTVALDSVRTAGVEPAQAFYAATAADVTDVVVDGRAVVRAGHHRDLDVARELAATV
jgi:formiminoglutamate deiminase